MPLGTWLLCPLGVMVAVKFTVYWMFAGFCEDASVVVVPTVPFCTVRVANGETEEL